MLKRILVLLLVSCSAVSAADKTPPSDASIRELLTVTDSKKSVEGMMGQVNAMMQSGVKEATKGQEISPAQQKIIDKTTAEVTASMSEALAWTKLEPLYLRVYQQSLTQEEVNGMIAFYKTPTGRAMITKMPVIMQNTMAEVQGMMGPLVQKMQQSLQTMAAELQAEQKKTKK